MIELDKIYNEDCLIGMKNIPDESVDCIICDLPYGTTECSWDSIIPFEPLWKQYKRILKTNGVICLFGNEPFSSKLRLSNLDWYRYDWYWEKNKFANFAQSPYMPLKTIETISVFSNGNIAANSKNKMNYYPQGLSKCHIEIRNRKCSENFRPNRKPQSFTQQSTGYPKQLLTFDKDDKSFHPTQKPVDLIRYLVLTYTNDGDTILDNCMGSGTTAIACIKEKRHFIGFELNKEYYDKACKRIKDEQSQLTLDLF